jgi:hypothetical protein
MRRAVWVAFVLASSAGCASFFAPTEDVRLAAWQAQASALRGHAFETPVELAWISRDEVPGTIRAELAGVVTAEDLRRYRDGYAALGLFPVGLDFLDAMLALSADQLAGLYSPRRKTLFVLDSLRDDSSSAGPGQSLIVVHELVHALQDQHFPEPLALLTRLRHQDDVIAAISAVLEGDATFTMLGADPSLGGTDGRTTQNAALVKKSMLAELDANHGAMAEAPRLLRESLIFPYAWGTPLAAQRFAENGNAGLDAALGDPPLSTLRVFAPADTDPIEFVRLPEAELGQRLAGRGCTLGDDNVVGALTLRVLFDEYGSPGQGASLMHGWSGDRYLQIDCGATWELVWLTRWDSAEAAASFAPAYTAIAPAIATKSQLSGVPIVVLRDRTALVVTPGLAEAADWLIDASEIRSYRTFVQWRQDGCFPETPCPVTGGN